MHCGHLNCLMGCKCVDFPLVPKKKHLILLILTILVLLSLHALYSCYVYTMVLIIFIYLFSIHDVW